MEVGGRLRLEINLDEGHEFWVLHRGCSLWFLFVLWLEFFTFIDYLGNFYTSYIVIDFFSIIVVLLKLDVGCPLNVFDSITRPR